LRARYAADRPKSNFAQITSALIALIALVAIYLQVDAGRKNALRSSARQVYLFYSGLLMQYPHLAVPDYARIMNDPDQTDRIRYELMMSNMLTAYDEILNADSGADWVAAFKFDLQIHIAYFCALTDPLYYAQFSKVALKVVAKEKAKSCPSLDLSKPRERGLGL